MRKVLMLGCAALLVASFSTMAEAAKKKAAAPADPNEAGGRLVVAALSQIFVPAQSIVAASQPKPAAPAKKGKKR